MTTTVPTPDPADEGDMWHCDICGSDTHDTMVHEDKPARLDWWWTERGRAAHTAAAVRAAQAEGIEEGRGDMAHWEARWKGEALRDAAARIRLGLDTSNHIGQGAEMACKQLDDLAARADTIATIEGGGA